MNIYTTLEIESLKNRYKTDASSFGNEKYNVSIPNQIIFLELETFNIENIDIDDIIKNMKTHIMNIMILLKKNNETFNYQTIIKSLKDDTEKNNIWIYRTYLLYQLLIIIVIILNNEKLYNTIFKETNYPYRDPKNLDLSKYKLCIFGSTNATSDIDIGIEYFDIPSEGLKPGLGYIISSIENGFIYFTGYDPLACDIEFYSDMMLMPKNIENNIINLFYLNSYNFNENDYKKISVYAWPCVSRNYLKTGNTDFNNLNIYNFVNYFNTYMKTHMEKYNIDIDITQIIEIIKKSNDAFNKAKTIITSYNKKD